MRYPSSSSNYDTWASATRTLKGTMNWGANLQARPWDSRKCLVKRHAMELTQISISWHLGLSKRAILQAVCYKEERINQTASYIYVMHSKIYTIQLSVAI